MTEKLAVVYRAVDDLIPYARNARTHSPEQVAQIAASIKEFGWTNPVLVDDEAGIIAGHGRVMAARRLGLTEVPTISLAQMSDAQKKAYILADNRLAENAGWDADLLKIELGELADEGFDLSLLGWGADELAEILGSLDGETPGDDAPPPTLAERFFAPPFSVLNAREGWWQDRKRQWIGLGIKSELGRGSDASPGGSPRPAADYSTKKRGSGSGKQMNHVDGVLMKSDSGNDPRYYAKKQAVEKRLGRELTTEEFQRDYYEGPDSYESGTSIFDPVLTELSYLWFCPPGGTILDPFAGGSVRGVVASRLGRFYVGVELREEQVRANEAQGLDLTAEGDPAPRWIHGDSTQIDRLVRGTEVDMIFSCPPYADLEVYSSNPADLSTMSYPAFVEAYREIIRKSCAMLRQDRFACFVVGDVRDKKGNYYDFVGDTVQAFRDAGLEFYNEAILVTALGSLPIRAAKAFSTTRKLGKTHQNVLVFLKGDAKRATKALGDIEIDEAALGTAEDGSV